MLEKLAFVEAGRRSAVVVLAGGHTIDRRVVLHGQYARLLLRQMDADIARLHAAAAGCRRQYLEATAARRPDPHEQAWLLGAELGDMAALIVGASGMHPDAGPDAREAVMFEADLWLGHLDAGGRTDQLRARWRRRRALAQDAGARRNPRR